MSKFQFGRPNAQTPKELGAQTPNWREEESLPSRVERVRVSARLPRQIVKKAKVFCAVNGIDLQDALAEGLELYLLSQMNFGRPNAQTPTIMIDDDDIKNPDSDSVPISSSQSDSGRPVAQLDREDVLLAFYAAQTGNRIKQRDRDVLEQVSALPDNAIKGGILKSILLCRTRVNSLSYCVGAILEMGADDPGLEYVQYLESKLRKHGPGTMAQGNLPGIGADVADITKDRKRNG